MLFLFDENRLKGGIKISLFANMRGLDSRYGIEHGAGPHRHTRLAQGPCKIDDIFGQPTGAAGNRAVTCHV